MAKVKTYSIDKREKYKIIGDFFDIIVCLKTKKEVVDFFMGLLTPSESLMMARRIQIARLLLEGENYESIRKKLKVSYQTINKTDRWINGEDELYNKWIKRCFANQIKNKIFHKNITSLDRYSHHRFLKEVLK